MARPSRKEGVISQFGAPRNAVDMGEVKFSERKFVELIHHKRTIRVPADYVHDAQLSHHPEKGQFGSRNYVDPIVMRAALSDPTDKLAPGKSYDITFYAISTKVSSADIERFLAANQSLMVGVQGLSLIYALMGKSLPFDRWIVAFDDRKHLFADDEGSFRVPMLLQPLCQASSLSLGHYGYPWQSKHAILVVHKHR